MAQIKVNKLQNDQDWVFVFHKITKKGVHAHNHYFCKRKCNLVMGVF